MATADPLLDSLRELTGRDDAVFRINEALRRHKLVCMLPDQHAGRKKGVVVDFMGVPASTFRGPAIAALRHPDARVYVGGCWRLRDDNILRARVRPVEAPPLTGDALIDVQRWTARMSHAMGELVLAHPECYLWHHRRWRARPTRHDALLARKRATTPN